MDNTQPSLGPYFTHPSTPTSIPKNSNKTVPCTFGFKIPMNLSNFSFLSFIYNQFPMFQIFIKTSHLGWSVLIAHSSTPVPQTAPGRLRDPRQSSEGV